MNEKLNMETDFFAGCTSAPANRTLEVEFATAARVGLDGASVTGATVDTAGELHIEMSDGRTVNAGRVVGASGLKGIAHFDTLPAGSPDPQLYIATAKGTYGYFRNRWGQPIRVDADNTIAFFFCPGNATAWDVWEMKLDLTGLGGKSFVGKRIVLYGESITNEYGVAPGTYVDRVKRKFGTDDVIQSGHSGEMLGSATNDKSDSLTDDQQIGFVTSSEPDLLILQGGVGDYWHGIPLGEYYGSVESAAYVKTTTGGLRYLLHHLTKNLPRDSKVLFVTPPPGTYEGVSDMAQNAAGHRIDEYVKRFRDICAEYHVPVCDAWALGGWSTHNENVAPYYTTDGVHLSALGYDRLTDLLITEAARYC